MSKKHILILLCLWHAMVVSAQDEERPIGGPSEKKGFMFGLNIGYLMPNDEPATFYDGKPKEQGFLDLNAFLGQWFIRDQVINTLGDRAANYRLSEYPQDYRYNNALAIGGHVRYQFNWTHAVVADMNFARLRSAGIFVIEYPGTTGLTQPVFESIEIREVIVLEFHRIIVIIVDILFDVFKANDFDFLITDDDFIIALDFDGGFLHFFLTDFRRKAAATALELDVACELGTAAWAVDRALVQVVKPHAAAGADAL